ncbi:hypothetical protein [Chryseobacterium arthrosphaerae]|uniref:hypothetical protein n=1 Tax=Chryseobacterium arthrosphaerae TaxID=651561 RepID=UPI001F4B19C8|nr:hypothetical protein [Chryseobacterium arthrosphaerae]
MQFCNHNSGTFSIIIIGKAAVISGIVLISYDLKAGKVRDRIRKTNNVCDTGHTTNN